MSTRCNILIKDENDQLWFYRHSDGYPSVTLPQLKKFMRWVKSKRIRDNVSQAAGWLIVLGNEEYRGPAAAARAKEVWGKKATSYGYGPTFEPSRVPDSMSGWKVGAFEPTTGRHGDIEYLYTLDLTTPTEIKCEHVWGEEVKKTKIYKV